MMRGKQLRFALGVVGILLLLTVAGAAAALRAFLYTGKPSVVITGDTELATLGQKTNAAVLGGVVLNERGAPGANVRVQAQWLESAPDNAGQQRWRTADVSTDARGHFAIKGVRGPNSPQLNLFLSFSRPNYPTLRRRPDPALLSKLLSNQATITVQEGFGIHGRAVDAAGQSVSGASVTIDTDRNRKLVTDSEGNFSASHIIPGDATIFVVANEKLFGTTRVKVAADTAPPTITLSPGVSVSGRAIDESGKPIADVEVYWYGQISGMRQSRTTAADGRFRFTDIPDEQSYITAEKDGYRGANFTPVSGATSDLVLHLSHAATIKGHVTDALTRRPIANFKIVLGTRMTGEKSPHFDLANAQPFKDGNFEYVDDQDRQGQDGFLQIQADGYLPVTSPLIKGNFTWDVAITPAANVAGIVQVADGSPAAGALISIFDPSRTFYFNSEPAGSEGQIKANTDGSFHLSPQAGAFGVVATASKGYAVATVDPRTDKVLDLRLRPWVSVHGHLPNPGAAAVPMSFNVQPIAGGRAGVTFLGGTTLDEHGFFANDAVADFDGQPLAVHIYINRCQITQHLRLTSSTNELPDWTGGATVTLNLADSSVGSGKGSSIALSPLLDLPLSQWSYDPKEAMKLARPSYGLWSSTGTISIPAVAPGRYILSIAGGKSPASLRQISVPASGVVDVSSIPAQTFALPAIGEGWPHGLGHHASGKPITTAEYQGKFLVVALLPEGDPSNASLDVLAEHFAGNTRLRLMALTMIDDAGLPLRRPAPINPAWAGGLMLPDDLPAQAMFFQNADMGFPSFIVFDPQGKLLSYGVDGAQAQMLLDKAMSK